MQSEKGLQKVFWKLKTRKYQFGLFCQVSDENQG